MGRLFPSVFAIVLPIGAGLTATGASAQDSLSFQSPSGNIHCMISTWEPAQARCDIRESTPSFRQPPAGCDLDWGSAFIADAVGPGMLGCVGDTVVDRAAPVLQYGQVVNLGPFSCQSADTGVTCRNGTGGGFFVSRASQSLF